MATLSALAPSHPPEYRRHRPEASLLYQVIEEYWPEFQAELAGEVPDGSAVKIDEGDGALDIVVG